MKISFLVPSLLVMLHASSSFSDEAAVNMDTLVKEVETPVFAFKAGHSFSDVGAIYEVKSPTLLSCIRKQIGEYNRVDGNFPGGSSGFADALRKKGIKARFWFYDYTQGKRAADSSIDSRNIFPDPHMISESPNKAFSIASSIGLNPETHKVECKIQKFEDLLNFFSSIKDFGFKSSAEGSGITGSGSAR